MDESYEIQLIKVPVSDIEASSRFYVENLGFEAQFVVAEYGWAQLSAGGVPFALYRPGMGGGDGAPGGGVDFHLSLPEEAFTARAQQLLEAGHLVEDEIHTADDGGTFMDVRDPDGNIIKISRR